ncbi:hypothetical protein MMC14_008779 [Varicellaria rhodocarpa]|nr:hypothetical protein [Varicellaria rhodocarpa]
MWRVIVDSARKSLRHACREPAGPISRYKYPWRSMMGQQRLYMLVQLFRQLSTINQKILELRGRKGGSFSMKPVDEAYVADGLQILESGGRLWRLSDDLQGLRIGTEVRQTIPFISSDGSRYGASS